MNYYICIIKKIFFHLQSTGEKHDSDYTIKQEWLRIDPLFDYKYFPRMSGLSYLYIHQANEKHFEMPS